MKKQNFLLLFITLFILNCDSTPLDLGFEYQELLPDTQTEISLDKKSGKYFVFTTSNESICTITLSELNTDFDLTLGEYREDTELEKLSVLETSKEPGVVDEVISFDSLDPNTSYLIEVWNYSTSSGTGTLNLTLQ